VTRSLGASLPPLLVERLAQRDLAARLGVALPFVTVDGASHPHPMLLSYLEVRAYDARTVGLGPFPVDGEHGLGYFLLEVQEVLEDAAADWEGSMRITGAIRYAPPPALDAPWARATLAALATPRARA